MKNTLATRFAESLAKSESLPGATTAAVEEAARLTFKEELGSIAVSAEYKSIDLADEAQNVAPGQDAAESAAALLCSGGDPLGALFLFVEVFHPAFLSKDEAEALASLRSIGLSLRRGLMSRAWRALARFPSPLRLRISPR